MLTHFVHSVFGFVSGASGGASVGGREFQGVSVEPRDDFVVGGEVGDVEDGVCGGEHGQFRGGVASQGDCVRLEGRVNICRAGRGQFVDSVVAETSFHLTS